MMKLNLKVVSQSTHQKVLVLPLHTSKQTQTESTLLEASVKQDQQVVSVQIVFVTQQNVTFDEVQNAENAKIL